MLCDINPEVFYKLTPRELFICFECFRINQKEKMDYDISLAWYNAYFQRVNKFPRLSEIIKQEPKVQTEEEMLNTVKKLAMRFGG